MMSVVLAAGVAIGLGFGGEPPAPVTPGEAVAWASPAGAFTVRAVDLEPAFRPQRVEVWGPVPESAEPHLLMAFTGWRFSAGALAGDGGSTPVGEDVTGDGVPDVVVREWSGGAHCCYDDHVISLASPVRLVASAPLGHGGDAAWVGGDDGAWAVLTTDSTFAYWRASFADSPMPRLRLTWREGRLAATPPADVDPADANDLEVEAMRLTGLRLEEAPTWEPSLAAAVLDRLYAGQRAAGWWLLDRVMPSSDPERRGYERELRGALESSPWWPDVSSFPDPGIGGGAP